MSEIENIYTQKRIEEIENYYKYYFLEETIASLLIFIIVVIIFLFGLFTGVLLK